MFSFSRRIATVAVFVMSISTVAGCSSSSSSSSTSNSTSGSGSGSASASAKNAADGTIVRVADQTISKEALEHWLPIEAILSREPFPQAPVPSGVIPDPPAYTACAAYLQATPSQRAATATGSPSIPQLTGQCRKFDQNVRQHTLQALISYAWTVTEARAQGIIVTAHELAQKWDQRKREQYPTQAILQKYLKYSRSTLRDQLLHLRFNLLSEKLGKKLLAEGGLARAKQFYSEFPRHWAAKTDCSPGYVIPECEQYKGPEAPEATI